MPDPRIDEFAAELVHRNGATVVVVRGEVDLATAARFRAALEAAASGRGRLEVDLRYTTFMDSTGIAVLVTMHRRLGQAHEAVVIRNPSPAVQLVLDVSGVTQLLDVRTEGTGAPRDGDRS